jgi:hypothetical protein
VVDAYAHKLSTPHERRDARNERVDVMAAVGISTYRSGTRRRCLVTWLPRLGM